MNSNVKAMEVLDLYKKVGDRPVYKSSDPFAALKVEGRQYFMQHHQLYPKLGFNPGSHLPKEGFEKKLGDFRIVCNPADGRRSGHRIMVECTCSKLVPFGRMGQHVKGKAHQS